MDRKATIHTQVSFMDVCYVFTVFPSLISVYRKTRSKLSTSFDLVNNSYLLKLLHEAGYAVAVDKSIELDARLA